MSIDPIALFETALKLSRRSSAFLFFGFLLIALSAYLASVVQDSGIPFWSIPVALLIFCVVVGSLAQMSGMLKTLLSWALVLVFFGWLCVLIAQILTQSRFTPPLASAACLIKPLDAQCGAIQASALPANAPPAIEVPAKPAVTALLKPVVEPGDNLVYVQFGVLTRQVVIDLSAQLVTLGWKVAGAASGGERLSAADGLMEVRYFHTEDAPRAALLAKTVTDLRRSTPAVALRDLSGTSLAKSSKPGQFEIWISR